MTRLILAAGVAAMAIATPLAAKPGGGHGGDKGSAQAAPQNNGNGGGGHKADRGDGGPKADRGGGGERGHRGGGGQAVVMGGGGGHGHGGGFAAPQQRVERQQVRGFERKQARAVERQQSRGFERKQARAVERQQVRGFERKQARAVERQQVRGFERKQARNIERQQVRGFEKQARNIERQQVRALERQQAVVNQQFRGDVFKDKGAKFASKEFAQSLAATPYSTLRFNDVQVVPVTQVQQFIGVPVAQVTSFTALTPLPATMQYFYPDTSDYYYRYGNGYLYQVDRSSSLIDALIPLLAGGFLPGQYLPASYMNSYVPAYYGFNSFYPDYNDVCNRYYYGVVYQVDCDDGYVENVIPMYAGGYGVGQLLPSAYTYYNVPTQYRSLYYDTPDYGYWYSPGAIYQYDQRSSMITSVASLLSPGFTVGQALPVGYNVYNVPYDYRATYYDTPDAWYRYNNGYIYQIDPVTQIVTAIVASLLT
jgi:hypothetical protein